MEWKNSLRFNWNPDPMMPYCLLSALQLCKQGTQTRHLHTVCRADQSLWHSKSWPTICYNCKIWCTIHTHWCHQMPSWARTSNSNLFLTKGIKPSSTTLLVSTKVIIWLVYCFYFQCKLWMNPTRSNGCALPEPAFQTHHHSGKGKLLWQPAPATTKGLPFNFGKSMFANDTAYLILSWTDIQTVCPIANLQTYAMLWTPCLCMSESSMKMAITRRNQKWKQC
jgi:hypothetical protein